MSTNHDTSREPGYSDLSNVMAAHPEIAIFRTFSTLNTQNLLYLQAELMHLEKELGDIREDDNSSGDPDRLFTDKNWLSLQRSLEEGRDPFQWAKFLDIRTKLAEYNSSQLVKDTTLLQLSQISALPQPTPHNLSLLRSWLERPRYGDAFLRGIESKTWDPEKAPTQFITLSPQPADQDALSSALRNFIPGFFHRHIGHRWKKPTDDNIFVYKDSHLDRAARGVCTFLSALLPTLSIFALYYVHHAPARLGLVLAFTTIFAVVLQLVARATPKEVFAATAAFAAVQVVFVGSTTPA